MLGHRDGIIGLPLRLLAREVYNRIVARVGVDHAALFTGEEKIAPPGARYRVCTVEAMPSRVDAAFVAVDEIQLASDLERGHVFTDRIMNLRGSHETLLLGAATMRGVIERLVPGVNIVTRPRMSVLAYTGSKKITRLPTRTAVVAFSSNDVYAIAELIRRQRGGAAVVLGALSPRTRNAQVEIYQSGDVDFLVATDAIGMGLNLDVKHVAFASSSKFDGFQHRRLTAAELGQIAGRAGRHMQDGTFGVTSRVEPLEDDLVEQLESHVFQPVPNVQWRNRELAYGSVRELIASLDRLPGRPELTKAPPAEDVRALAAMAKDQKIAALADRAERIEQLWEVCQIPDYRKISPAQHAELLTSIFTSLVEDGRIGEDWFAGQLAFADRTEGDIDTLSTRIAHIRTWTFAANRNDWFADPAHWQERTRAIEDRLSDALHERLTARFIDRRTSVLMRRLKENTMLEAEITAEGDVMVEGQHIGSLDGFRFTADPEAAGPEAKALRAAAQKALAGEVVTRADRLARAPDDDLALATDGTLRWSGSGIARLTDGDDPLKPRLILLADDSLPEAARDRVRQRTDLWLATRVETLLKPLFDLRAAASLAPEARGIAFRLAENLGVLERSAIAEEVRGLDQDARAGMRTLGVRFGAYHIYVPALLKPAPAGLVAMLWALKNGGLDAPGLLDLTQLAGSGRTSVPVDTDVAHGLYYAVGYKPCGTRAVRIDILERLADIIRPLLAWRPTPDAPTPPPGALEEYGFTVTVEMTSLLGCAGDDFAAVLSALGYRSKRRPRPTAPELPADESPAAAPVSDPPAADAAEDSQDTAAAPVQASEEGGAAAAEAPAVEPAAASEDSEPDATPAATEPVATEPATTEPAATESTETESTETEAAPAEEPAFLVVWRPAPNRPPRARRGGARTERRADNADGKRPPRRAAKPDGRRKDKPAKRTAKGSGSAPSPRTERKAADPDSPFAALAALKDELESQKRGG